MARRPRQLTLGQPSAPFGLILAVPLDDALARLANSGLVHLAWSHGARVHAITAGQVEAVIPTWPRAERQHRPLTLLGRPVHSSSLAALALGIGAGATLGQLEPVTLSAWFTGRYRDTAGYLEPRARHVAFGGGVVVEARLVER
jgi:hypothetical protein